MKSSSFQVFLCACLLFACTPTIYAQSEIGLRPLFFQNDFSSPNGQFDDAFQGFHAGEWQFGVSGRKHFSTHFAGRLETNFTRGRYPGSSIHFAYLSLCVLPEWHVSPSVFLAPGAFVNKGIKDPFGIEQSIATGLLANVGLRHGNFEIQCRFQHWLGPSGKFTFGAGLDYFIGLNKKSNKSL